MFSFMLNLIVLSVMLSLSGAAAMLLRHLFLRSKEGMMYPVWILVLAVSILPLGFNFGASEDTDKYSASTAELSALESSGTQGMYADPSDPSLSDADDLKETRTLPSFILHARRILSSLAAKLESIATALFVLWIAGAVIRFTLAAADYLQAMRLLELSSQDCTGKRIRRIAEECRTRLGISRRVRIRMLETESLCSPCVCGCFRPTIYIEPGCSRLSESGLRCVLTHELCHIRRNDMLLKLFTLFVTSVHWFNPTSRLILKMVYEDCELACDTKVIEALGRDIRGTYMTTILDFAERFSDSSRLLGSEAFGGGLFMSQPGGAHFLRKRYTNMKVVQSSRAIIAGATAFVIICTASSFTALSAASAVTPRDFTSAMKLTPQVEMMVRAYYGLSSDDFITPELIDGIKTLEISADRSYGDRTLVEFTVNGEEGYACAVPAFALQDYFNSHILPKIALTADSVDEIAYYSENGDLLMATFDTRVLSFYCLKDPYDCRLTRRAVEEMKLTYPVIRSKGSLYVFDPFSSDCDMDSIYRIFDEAGLLDLWTLSSNRFDASSLAYFTNLSEVRFDGIEPIGCDVKSSVKVIIE